MAQVGANMEYQEYKWAYSIMDSSKVSACLISMLLIVYGSFRSLNMEREARERAEKERETSLLGGKPTVTSSPNNNVQTLNTMQALCFPLGSSVALLIMFFFFDSMQTLVAICTAVIACAALAFLLTPLCQYVAGGGGGAAVCGRYSAPELAAALLAAAIVAVWVLTGHWLLMDAMGMGLCVTFIALIRLPSLKVSTLLLTGLLLYDVFWVFFSSYIFTTNVMVKVATRPAENPMNVVARRLQLGGAMRDAPKLSLPAKLVFPSMHHQGHFSMLGLGDIVMPGLLLCFVLRYDAYKKATLVCQMGQVPGPRSMSSRVTYFHCSLLGYFLGLLTATVSAEVFKAAQPALLYLVPFTLLPLLTMAYVKGDLRRMWSEPFITPHPSKSAADFDV
ncbi:signal peptide peptidase-like 3 [Aricia agestis]|uniref:signal peptide peptidase-like 3 n=1 Tax=Aricia agestis TaxID=91739 RepID=UPI001C209515|nr:signal peptide peptidase-like 3 [Aricia agestis]